MNKLHLVAYLTIMVCVIGYIQAIPLESEEEIEKEKSCKGLCEHCGCVGYYCGDECICECNVEDNEDIQCAATMQSNCQKMKLPFEVLIQGPSGNRFIRSLIHADPNYESLFESEPEERKTRSTISIYRPEEDEAEQYVQNLEPQVQNIHPEQIDTNDQLAEEDDIVTMVHQPQAEPLTAVSDVEEVPQAEPLTAVSYVEEAPLAPIQASDDELSLDELSELPKTAGSKREAVFDIDQDAAVDTLYEESAVNKRDVEEELISAVKTVIVQPTTPPPPPELPNKTNLVRDAVNRAKARAQSLRENAAAQRTQAADLINNAIENVKNKINNLPALPTLPSKPTISPPSSPPALPAKPIFKNLFNKDPNVGSIQLTVVPSKNLPLPIGGLNNRLIVNPKDLITPQTALQNLNNNIAVRKAVAQAAIDANLATLNAGLLPVWNNGPVLVKRF